MTHRSAAGLSDASSTCGVRHPDGDKGGGPLGRRAPASGLRRVVWLLCRPAFVPPLSLASSSTWKEFLFGLMLTTQNAVPVTVGASFFFATSGGECNGRWRRR